MSTSEVPNSVQAYIDNALNNNSINSWSFILGFLLGQITVVLLVLAFVKFMLLEDSKNTNKKRPILFPTPSSSTKSSSIPSTSSAPSIILSKTFYDPIHHLPESTDWLNVLLAQAINLYRDDAQTNNRLLRVIDEALNSGLKPDFVGPIHLTKLNLGEEYPLFSNARIMPIGKLGRVRAEIDCQFNDQVSLGIDTQILINWPRPRIAILPISLMLSVVKFSTTLAIEIVNPPETSSYVAISALPDFILEFDVQSFIGSRTKLESVPKNEIKPSLRTRIIANDYSMNQESELFLPPSTSSNSRFISSKINKPVSGIVGKDPPFNN
ncbi:9952_t:CDS:2 [Ambispora gerdemannii]|uniref:Maintenance of mitochondrial morphology protein 1 n=1 Tax=Ambispora gerdemannii TaxID=144530 RepID=A0A9N9BE04_9GLOM|nr:9952_t:CDS:2 [Ambispora gerdemannii]